MRAGPNVCIVTPEIIGPINNGGIGTHCWWLARLLADQGDCRTTILFTQGLETGKAAHFREEFMRKGLGFVCLSDLVDEIRPDSGQTMISFVSGAVFRFVRDAGFDFIHFQDCGANGYLPIQAKRAGSALADAVLTVTMHGACAWIREGNPEEPHDPLYEAQLDRAERYCCEHADHLISPSRFMFRWARSRGWRLAEQRSVIPGLIYGGDRTPSRMDLSHLVFFGRLETLKGLELFCAALTRLVDLDARGGVDKVTFLGKPRNAAGAPALDFLRKAAEPWLRRGVVIDVKPDLDSPRAIAFLKESGALAVMPSLRDNSPYAVLECLEHGIPFLASNAGGIPELVEGDVLFDPEVGSLVDILERRTRVVGAARKLYSAEEARRKWIGLHAVSRPPVPAVRPIFAAPGPRVRLRPGRA